MQCLQNAAALAPKCALASWTPCLRLCGLHSSPLMLSNKRRMSLITAEHASCGVQLPRM